MKKNLVLMTIIATILSGVVACSKADTPTNSTQNSDTPQVAEKADSVESEDADTVTSASTDGTTSASVVPEKLVDTYKPKGFTDEDSKKALFVVADPRKYSVNYDLANTAMEYFEENGIEVELRDLYDMEFDPVVSPEEFYYAKDGTGEASEEIMNEQELVSQADHIIFVYPNWHDTPTAIVKGYMERVFAKQFAYRDTDSGLEGLLKDKSIYTIMNAGFLGGGRGYIGDGVGIDDEAWDEYMKAFKVMDDDTAGFWGLENKGRFVNDRTPSNSSENYEEEITELREDLKNELQEVFFE